MTIIANPFALYFNGLYELTLQHDWLHELIHVHFIVTGCLFFWPLLGSDPLPNRWPYPGRALLMVISVPFHTVLGLTIMQSKVLIAGDYYPNLNLSWADPWKDQVLAGGILWAAGEIVSNAAASDATVLNAMVIPVPTHATHGGEGGLLGGGGVEYRDHETRFSIAFA